MQISGSFTTSAQHLLRRRWTETVIISLVYIGVSIVAQTLLGGFSIFVLAPLYLGWPTIALKIYNSQTIQIRDLFIGYRSKKRLIQSFATVFLVTIFLILWFLLLIVPGIVKCFAYSQVMFLIADDPNLTAMEAIKTSDQIMTGKKRVLLSLCCRLLGWFILSILTLGIGFLWFIPYATVSCVCFFKQLSPNRGEQQSGV